MEEKPLEINRILQEISEDSRVAFNSFYNLYYTQVFRFCYYFLKENEACKEVVSDVFFSVWKSRMKLKEVSNIEVYLYAVAKNASLNYLKKASSFQYVSIDEIPMTLDQSDDNPENTVLSSEIDKLLTDVVSNLPEKCRVIFLMARHEGLEYKEIANALGLAESTVRVQMKIAIDKIIVQIKQLYPNLNLSVLLFLLLCFNF